MRLLVVTLLALLAPGCIGESSTIASVGAPAERGTSMTIDGTRFEPDEATDTLKVAAIGSTYRSWRGAIMTATVEDVFVRTSDGRPVAVPTRGGLALDDVLGATMSPGQEVRFCGSIAENSEIRIVFRAAGGQGQVSWVIGSLRAC